MKPYNIDISTAIKEGSSLPYCLIYSLSSVYIGPTPEQITLNQETLEAHFFGQDMEIRVFKKDGRDCAVKIESNREDEYIEKTYHLDHGNSKLMVHEELDYDTDGQAYIANIKLVGWEGDSNQ